MMTVPIFGAMTVVVKDPHAQRAVWFLGALVKERLGGDDTGDSFAVLEHNGNSGYNSPMHVHGLDDETFVVLDGRIELTTLGEVTEAEAGSTVFLPKGTAHGFVVASKTARS